MMSEDVRPILVQFENGILKRQRRGTTKFKYLRSKVPKSTKRMLYADTGALTYTGTVVQKQQGAVKYYIGVVDRETNTIEHVEMCQICILKPNVHEEIARSEDLKTEKTFRQKSDILVEAFGSAKQKRLVSSRKKNEGVQETAAQKVADIASKIVAKSPISELSGTSTTPGKTEELLIIPPQNQNAERMQDIYHVDDIISFQEYQLIKKEAQGFISLDNKTLVSWKNERKYPEYILHHLSQLPLSSSEREEKACYICFLLYLITIYKLTYKDVQKRDPCPDIPNPLKTLLLDRFTHSENGKNRCVPKKYKDKVLCYLLVLALIIEEYEMDCNLLLKDLTLGVARLIKLLRAIGCVVRTSNTKTSKDADGLSVPANPIVTASLNLSVIRAKSKYDLSVAKTPVKNVKNEEPTIAVTSQTITTDILVKKSATKTLPQKSNESPKKHVVLRKEARLKEEPMETD